MQKNEDITSVKLHSSTINELFNIALETNRQLIAALIEEMHKINKENTIQIMNDLQKKKRENERLYNLKELSKILKIAYGTLSHYELPFRTIGRSSRKMYNLNEVNEYLKR